jgi:hypothetical protein
MAYQVTFFKGKYLFSRAKMSAGIFSGIHLRPALPRIGPAPRGFTVGEGTLSAESPQTPGSGGTDSALRLVTCRSSDALRLSSSGRTSRQSAAESSCSLRFPCAFLLPWPEASRNTQC